MGFVFSSALKVFFGKLVVKLSKALVRRGRDSDAVDCEEVVVVCRDFVPSCVGSMKLSRSTLALALM